ncbi:MAG: response regulator [Deltaproteobacteria bacterium]|nr:response regulator [Deltaproteobacteria bacterium]
MDPSKILMGKRVLIVDDERDILETLTDLLDLCKIDRASSFEAAVKLLEQYEYDLAVLDIMGVKGFDLLEIAKKRNIPALMLTAHSLNAESLAKSVKQGAAYFVPKQNIAQIATYAADVLEAKEHNKSPWARWFERLGGFFDVMFTGPNWRQQEKDLLEKLKRAGY